MAFWGIEVKPGKPFTHSFDRVRGRLRISQATLATGSSTKKSLVQCNIGDKRPVLLCALLPDKTESCQLDLEFEEADEVVFSVIGPRSVFLTGYYVSNGRHSNLNDDTDSYGEDIANTETEGSDQCSDDDEYEDSFINDGDTEVFPPSPVSSGGVVEETVHVKKPRDRKDSHKRLKKKYQSVESDDETTSWQLNIFNRSRSVPESEGEDNFPISSLYKNKTTAKDMIMEAAEEKANKGTVETGNNTADDTHAMTEDDDTCRIELKGNADALVIDNEPKRGSDLPTTEVGPENGVKPKKKRKERSREEETLEADCGNHINALKAGKTNQAEAEANNLDQDLLVRNKLELKPINNMGNDLSHNSLLPSMELGSENGAKVKKRRKERDVEDQAQQDEVKADSMGRDLPVRNEPDQKPASDKRFDIDADRLADGYQSGEKKIKRKKKKKSASQEEKENVDIDTPFLPKDENNRFIIGLEDKNVDARSSQVRTLSNGLIIEELKKGKSEGKIAAPGRKVKVQFIVKLKENGQIIDSNIGKAPYKFRLGDDEVIEGWNVGLDGMQVGDQRRLIVPPSMGYGNQGTGQNIPPNSWLIYEVELIGVR